MERCLLPVCNIKAINTSQHRCGFVCTCENLSLRNWSVQVIKSVCFPWIIVQNVVIGESVVTWIRIWFYGSAFCVWSCIGGSCFSSVFSTWNIVIIVVFLDFIELNVNLCKCLKCIHFSKQPFVVSTPDPSRNRQIRAVRRHHFDCPHRMFVFARHSECFDPLPCDVMFRDVEARLVDLYIENMLCVSANVRVILCVVLQFFVFLIHNCSSLHCFNTYH